MELKGGKAKGDKGKKRFQLSKKKAVLVGGVGGVSVLALLAGGMFLLGGDDEYYPPAPPPAPVKSVPQQVEVPAQPQQPQTQQPQVQQPQVSSQMQEIKQENKADKQKKDIDTEKIVKNDVKLVGDCLKEAVDEAVNKIVSEEKQRSEEELKKKWEEAVKTLQQKFSSLSEESRAEEGNGDKKKRVSTTPMGEDMLPALIKATAKVVLADGRILLSTPTGDLVKGTVISGWTVEKIDDRYVYVKKTVEKKESYRVKKRTPEGLTYYETKYRTKKEVKHKKIPYVVEF